MIRPDFKNLWPDTLDADLAKKRNPGLNSMRLGGSM